MKRLKIKTTAEAIVTLDGLDIDYVIKEGTRPGPTYFFL